MNVSRDTTEAGVHAKTSNGDDGDVMSFDEDQDLAANDNSDLAKMGNSSQGLETVSRTPRRDRPACASGYQQKSHNLDGVGKQFSHPGEGTENCAKVCDERPGCTSYEYNHGGNEDFKCGTYTGGKKNIRNQDQLRGWTTCIRKDNAGEKLSLCGSITLVLSYKGY